MPYALCLPYALFLMPDAEESFLAKVALHLMQVPAGLVAAMTCFRWST